MKQHIADLIQHDIDALKISGSFDADHFTHIHIDTCRYNTQEYLASYMDTISSHAMKSYLT